MSFESQAENETLHFMRRFVTILFRDSSLLTLELKSEFGRKTRVSVQIVLELLLAAYILLMNTVISVVDRRRLVAFASLVSLARSGHRQKKSAKIHSTRSYSTLLLYYSNVQTVMISRQPKSL